MVIILGVKKYFKVKIFQSLRFRIAVLVIIAGIVPAMIMKTVILKSYEKQTVDTRTADIQNQCTILCNQLSAVNYQQGVTSDIIKSELTQLSNIYNGRVMVIDKDYHIVEDTYDMDEGKTIISEDVILCFRGEGTSHYDAENRYIEVTSPILDNDKKEVNGVVLVSVSTDNISDNLIVISGKADLVLAVSGLLIVLLAIISGMIMVRPFQRITRAIGAVTEGYEDDYLKEYSYTETRLLSEAFNKMLGRMKTLDESKNQFVSNVSHELKTPLTSMKVLSDSLLAQEDVPNELYKEFMSDLSEEIDRENKIINDLLALTRLEKNAKTMNITNENINMLVERILKRLRPIAATRNIEVIFESFRPVNAEVDEVKLSLAISNLVENAIKYNKENGWIHVSLNADHKSFYMEVADSGVGISKEDLGHIFERFYRVDKSHSRDTGGTGLGLAIARSAIVMHRGAIKVYSQPGEGTTFTVRIPLTYVV
ncbi:MAG: sensor histidine kinase [Lachnospiraceae bacterium]